jgi:nitric oxide reductase NorD protein
MAQESDWHDESHEDALRLQASTSFPADLHQAWIRACRRLSGAGYGESVTDAYARSSPELARLVSPQAAIDLAGRVSGLAIRSGRGAAALLPQAATTAAAKLGGKPFAQWLRLIDYANASASESMASILERTAQLLTRLDLEGLESWLRIGIRMAEGDGKRRLRFFTMEDPAGRRWLRRLSGETNFADMESRLRPFLAALWGDHPPLRETPPGAPEEAQRRAGFDGMVVRLPASFPGFSAADAERLFRAAVAHIAAHLKFSRVRFPIGGLKPTQVALVSLIEDARVERLAMREMPGLARLFLPFHTI